MANETKRNYKINVRETNGATATATANIITNNEKYILCVYPMKDNNQVKTIASLYVSRDSEPYSVSSYEIMEDGSIKMIKVYKETVVLEDSIIKDCLAAIHNNIAK